MYFITKILIYTILIQLVSSQRYLFEGASVNIKRYKDKSSRHQIYTKVITIDQRTFPNAVQIKIQTKKMKLYDGAVKNMQYLESLRLKNCGIDRLPPKSFFNLPKLQELRLHENNLTIIVNGVFNYLPIRELWLQRNQIASIYSSAFDNMPNLEVIRLNKNKLTRWDSRWFAHTPKLSQLFFKRNFIMELPRRAFINIKGSHRVNGEEIVDTQIMLNSNLIKFIHLEAFLRLDSLDKLDLRNNSLKKIEWKMFTHMRVLRNVSFALNDLEEIDADAFENVEEILELNLSKNNFECIPYEIVSKAKRVNLTKNKDFQCDCLNNLKEKLSDDKIENEIVIGECAQE